MKFNFVITDFVIFLLKLSFHGKYFQTFTVNISIFLTNIPMCSIQAWKNTLCSEKSTKQVTPGGTKPVPIQGTKPVLLEGTKPVPLERGTKLVPLEGSRPVPLEGTKNQYP